MADSGGGRSCGVCKRTLQPGDEWIALDGGEIWCAECWGTRFGGGPAAFAATPDSNAEATVAELTIDALEAEARHAADPMEAFSAHVAQQAQDALMADTAFPADGPAQWFYLVSGRQVGPVPTEAFIRMMQTGQADGNTMVWHQGMASWTPAALAPEFAAMGRAVEPALQHGAAYALPAPQVVHRGKSKVAAALLALFIGGLGIHKFYLGGWGWGILYIVFVWTFIPAIVSFIEAIILLFMSDAEFDRRYNLAPVDAFTW